jgi:hypothetical protein
MASAFQNIIDNAESISINKRKKVAQTVSRDGVVRTLSLGGQVWTFEVKLPDGPRWTDYRSIIEQIEALDRVTSGTIQINKTGHSWITAYKGNLVTAQQSNIVVTATTGNTVTITSGGTGLIAGQYRFRAGDIIQLGTGAVYSVAADVAYNANTIILNRPLRDAAGTYTLKVGQAVTWTVICTQFPQWSLTGRDFLTWNGPFVLTEAL